MRASWPVFVALAGCSLTQDNPAFTTTGVAATTGDEPGTSTDTTAGSTSPACEDDPHEPADRIEDAIVVDAPAEGSPLQIASVLAPTDVDWFSYTTPLDPDERFRYGITPAADVCACIVPRCVGGSIEDIPGCPGRLDPEGYTDSIDGFVACCTKAAFGIRVGVECGTATDAEINIVVLSGPDARERCGDAYAGPTECSPYFVDYDVVAGEGTGG